MTRRRQLPARGVDQLAGSHEGFECCPVRTVLGCHAVPSIQSSSIAPSLAPVATWRRPRMMHQSLMESNDPAARVSSSVAPVASERAKKLQCPRQLLSCTKCRERKVKVSESVEADGLATDAVRNSVIARSRARRVALAAIPRNASSSWAREATTVPSSSRMRFAS